jgi:DNA-binding transcriptional MerR regulator
MSDTPAEAVELTYSVNTAARLTGLSPTLLRAWERRYGVVEPTRTPGGTRRYTADDLERLRLVKAAVDAGHRIGKVARLDLDALRELAAPAPQPSAGRQEEVLAALNRLDGVEAQRLLALHFSALGPVRFAREFACPLVREIGERWADDRIGVPAEHLASAVLRSMLGAALQPTAVALMGPRIVFATPTGERHELGLLMAALTAMGAGANPLYLGAELPVDDLLGAVEHAGAAALALSVVTVPPAQALRALNALRGGLPSEVRVWVGGAGAGGLRLPEGVERIETLEELERRVALLGLETARRR